MNAQKLLPIAAIIFAGCENTPLATLDGGTGPAPTQDSGMVAPPPDAGEVGFPDAMVMPEPARTFVERRMFGETPVDNLVFDPIFDLTTYNWYAFSSDFAQFIPLEKHYLADSPMHVPSIRVRKDRGISGAIVIGNTASTEGMLQVSVWVGRAAEDAADTATAAAAIINIAANGAETAIDLVSDPSSRVERDGIVWVRQTGIVADALGVLTFLIGDEEREPFWATAPVVLPMRAHVRPDTKALAEGRPLSGRERAALSAFEAAKRTRQDPRTRADLKRGRSLAKPEGG
jgi:hypothetical protein